MRKFEDNLNRELHGTITFKSASKSVTEAICSHRSPLHIVEPGEGDGQAADAVGVRLRDVGRDGAPVIPSVGLDRIQRMNRISSFSAGRQIARGRTLSSAWHHVAAGKAADRLTLHVDGQRVASTTAVEIGSYRLDVEAPLRLGDGMNGPLNGRLSDVRV